MPIPRLPDGFTEEKFRELFEDWVQFCPVLARLCGSAAAGLMLSKAFSWSRTEQVIARGGWFWKTSGEWEEETCLSRREQQTARDIIRQKGFWEEKKRKINGAPTLHFRINLGAILGAHFGVPLAKMEMAESPNQKVAPTENGNGGSAKSEMAEAPNQTPVLAKMEFHETPNAIRKQSTHTDNTNIHTRDTKAAPLSPSVLVIAKEKFWRVFDSLPSNQATSAERDEWERLSIATTKSGLTRTQVKTEILREHPRYGGWAFTEQFDSQHEIVWPDPSKTQLGNGKVIRPHDFVTTPGIWSQMQERLKAAIGQHSWDTWFKPTRESGLWRNELYVRIPTVEFRAIGQKFGDQLLEMLSSEVRDIKFLTAEEEYAHFNQQTKSQTVA